MERIGLAYHRPAAVDHLLRAALDFGVPALHRIEVEILDVRSGVHAGRCAPAHADQQPRTADLTSSAPGFTAALCDCEADIAPTPPASMIGLW